MMKQLRLAIADKRRSPITIVVRGLQQLPPPSEGQFGVWGASKTPRPRNARSTAAGSPGDKAMVNDAAKRQRHGETRRRSKQQEDSGADEVKTVSPEITATNAVRAGCRERAGASQQRRSCSSHAQRRNSAGQFVLGSCEDVTCASLAAKIDAERSNAVSRIRPEESDNHHSPH
jgi:hypothetical protein